MTVPSIFVAAEPPELDEALRRLERYPAQTPATYDYPGPGKPSIITVDEIRRTRAVSSRISVTEGDWFIAVAAGAPRTAVHGDLRNADPAESGSLYDSMLRLYDHFAGTAPKGVNMAKVSKVLHLKRPHQFPILDGRLRRDYAAAAERAAAAYGNRNNRRVYWAAIRSDLIRSTDGLTELRNRIAAHTAEKVRAIQAVTDLRLLDMLAW